MSVLEWAMALDKANLEMVLMIGDKPSSFDVVLPLFPTETGAKPDSKERVPG
jgi:hypothetical protein